jgi:hypothetical protein
VQYQNPSVEEFVDHVLSSDPHSVERLTNCLVTFRQVYQLVSHALNAKPLSGFNRRRGLGRPPRKLSSQWRGG